MRGGTSAARPMMTIPAVPSIVIVSPSATSRPPNARAAVLEVDHELVDAGDARLAHPACDHGGMRGDAAERRHDPPGLNQTVDVGGRGLRADEDDALACAAARLCGVRIEHHDAARGSRRGVQPGRRDVQFHARIEHRVQQLVELSRVDAPDRLLAVDQALADHGDGCLDRRRGRPLA